MSADITEFEKARDVAAQKHGKDVWGDERWCNGQLATETDFSVGSNWARQWFEAEIEKEQEHHHFYKREWESCCERYDYAREEQASLKAEIEGLNNEIVGFKEINSIQKTYLRAAEVNEARLKSIAESYRAKLLKASRIADRGQQALLPGTPDQIVQHVRNELITLTQELRAALELGEG